MSPAASASGALIGLPVTHMLQGLLDADQPRQSLRALGARDDAEVHFRLTEQRLRNGHAIVPGHRQLQPAAERSCRESP